MEELLKPPACLNANPEAYDYIHAMRLLEANSIEILAGDGQKMWFKAIGKFHMDQRPDVIHFRMFDIKRCDPYDDSKLGVQVPDFECSATLECAQFLLPDGLPNSMTLEKQQYLAFDRRFIFDVDPIRIADSEIGIPIPFTHDDSERVYYVMSECRRGTLKQLARPRLYLPDKI